MMLQWQFRQRSVNILTLPSPPKALKISLMISLCTRVSRGKTLGAFHSTKNSKISGLKLNGTIKIPGKVFENLGIRFECTLFDGISGIIENFVFHSQKMSGLVSLPSIIDRMIRFPVCHTPKEQQYLFFWQNCRPPR